MGRKVMVALVMMLFTATSALAQQLTVSGKIIDERGEPVIGASIIEQGTTNGTTTNVDGSYSLKIKGGGTTPPTPPTPPTEQVSDVSVWVTTLNGSHAFTYEGVAFSSVGMSPNRITLKPEVQFQEIDGFGAALTGSSCYNLQKMSAADRAKLLKETFDPKEGKGFSFLRLHIGGSDFSMDEYTCGDQEGIEHFAIPQIEREGIFPVLREILAINPNIKLMGSPWSCPRWMKGEVNNPTKRFNSWTSGRLNPNCYADYATYFVKWCQEMEAEGFPIYAITMQNEPLNHGNSMSLYMPWEDQLAFVKVLGPAFEKAGVTTKILLFDHNYNYDNKSGQEQYPLHIYADPEASKWVDGSAWHNYGGHVSELDRIHASAPDKSIYFTEASIGTWCGNGWNEVFKNCLLNDFDNNFLGVLNRHGKGVIMWNLMLDDEGKPYRPGGCSTCYGAIEINHNNYKDLRYSSHYYNIAHCSKVIEPGAVRIDHSQMSLAGLTYATFQNPDGSFALVALNKGGEALKIAVKGPEKGFRYEIPAQSIVSFRWSEAK